MNCPNCGKELEANQKFCTGCGCELKTKKTFIINTILAVILSAFVCIIPYLAFQFGIVWFYVYSFAVIPLFLFAIIISYGKLYKNKITSKSIIVSIVTAFILSALFFGIINFVIQTVHYTFFIISKFLIIPNIILAFLVAFKRNEIKSFVLNNIRNKE